MEEGWSFLTVMHQVAKRHQQDLERGQEKDVLWYISNTQEAFQPDEYFCHEDFPRDLLIKPQKASAVREFAQEGCFRIKKPLEAQANGFSVLDLLQIQLFST